MRLLYTVYEYACTLGTHDAVLTAASLTFLLHVGKKKKKGWGMRGKGGGQRRQNISLRPQNTGAHIAFPAPANKLSFGGADLGKKCSLLAEFKLQLNSTTVSKVSQYSYSCLISQDATEWVKLKDRVWSQMGLVRILFKTTAFKINNAGKHLGRNLRIFQNSHCSRWSYKFTWKTGKKFVCASLQLHKHVVHATSRVTEMLKASLIQN